jgi:hypothetical protein
MQVLFEQRLFYDSEMTMLRLVIRIIEKIFNPYCNLMTHCCNIVSGYHSVTVINRS